MAPNLIRETLARIEFSKENIKGKLFFRIFFWYIWMQNVVVLQYKNSDKVLIQNWLSCDGPLTNTLALLLNSKPTIVTLTPPPYPYTK